MIRGRLPTSRLPFMRQVLAATNRRHFVRCSLSGSTHDNPLDVSAGDEQTRSKEVRTVTAVTKPLAAEEGPADVRALATDSSNRTQAEGQQALTAQPAMPAAQQTTQTADADQASTSQALATTAQHAQPARTSPRGSHGLGSARGDPTPGLVRWPYGSFHSRASHKLLPNPQLTTNPINTNQQT